MKKLFNIILTVLAYFSISLLIAIDFDLTHVTVNQFVYNCIFSFISIMGSYTLIKIIDKIERIKMLIVIGFLAKLALVLIVSFLIWKFHLFLHNTMREVKHLDAFYWLFPTTLYVIGSVWKYLNYKE